MAFVARLETGPPRRLPRSRSRRIGDDSDARSDYCRVEWWTGTRRCAYSRPPRVAEARTLRASGILPSKASFTGSINARVTRKYICGRFKLNLGSFCHFMEKANAQAEVPPGNCVPGSRRLASP